MPAIANRPVMPMNPKLACSVAVLSSLLGTTVSGTAEAAKGHPPAASNPRAKQAAPARPLANDFPTQARVEYVMQCMAERGGANLDNMYHCVCAVDKIASLTSFQDYSEALTFTYMFDTPGEKGGEFRDPPKSKIFRDRLKDARQQAESCFPKLAATPATPAAPVQP